MEKYNWWTDPKNAKEVERLSWWNDPKNMDVVDFPISIIEDSGHWIIVCNDKTKELIGDRLHASVQGSTKEEAIKEFFNTLRICHLFAEYRMFKYQRWVPFRKGNWSQIGGTWFVIFGIHFYFRYGENMKHGFYIPFTKLNILISSDWVIYRDWKKKMDAKPCREAAT